MEGAKGMAIRNRPEGKCMNTSVFSRPIIFASHAQVGARIQQVNRKKENAQALLRNAEATEKLWRQPERSSFLAALGMTREAALRMTRKT